jgi:carbon-monoxide dehydrogenase large subunit
MERLIDRAADEMGINRLTLRKRNFIKPAQMPFQAASGVTYDSGDFQAVLTKALELSDHANFARRKKESKKSGKLRGIAVGSYLEVTAPPSGELGKITFEPDWSVKLTTGTLGLRPGPRHAVRAGAVRAARRALREDHAGAERQRSRALRQRHRRLALDHRDRSGDRRGSRRSWSPRASRRRASDGGAEGDIEFGNGRFTIAGTDRSIGIMELAQRLRDGKVPEGVPSSLDVDHATKDTPSTFPNGCHVAEVEIDPETGVTQIVRYTGISTSAPSSIR